MIEIIKINDSKNVRIIGKTFGFVTSEPDDVYYCVYKVQIKIFGFIWITIKEYWYSFAYEGLDTDINWQNTDDYYRMCAEELYEHLIKNE